MREVSTIGLDLAKNVFQVHGVDAAGKVLVRRQLRRGDVLRFFGGLSVEETAEVLKISPQSVMRDWKLARAWLQRELSRSG